VWFSISTLNGTGAFPFHRVEVGCRWRSEIRVFYSSPSLRGPGQRLPDFDVRTCITSRLRGYEIPASERVNECVSERALGYVRKSILRRRGTLSGRPPACGTVRRGRKKKRTPPSRGQKKKTWARGERRIRDKAQKRWPGKTGGRKSWPLIGKSKFVLRKLSAGERCERTRETADAA